MSKTFQLILEADKIAHPGKLTQSSAQVVGEKLKQTMIEDPDFYLFSPDETTSNKLDATYSVSARAWLDRPVDWDLPSSPSGRIIELLSENVLASLLIGHILSGKQGMMTSYEAFFTIIISQINQYVKFINQAEQVAWRSPRPALNLLSTSTCWRQDHNGYSHQSPSLISSLLNNPSAKSNCFFPVDSISASAIYDYMLTSHNVVNLTTFNKTTEPIWIDSNHAHYQLEHGASIFGFASSPNFSDTNQDYVFIGVGDIVSREVLYAIQILKNDLPNLNIRYIGISALSYGKIGTINQPLSQDLFNQYFGSNATIVANFHGYPADLKNILSNYTNRERLIVHGYEEKGSTTTPFEMLSLNHASRYHLCLDVASRENRLDLVKKYQEILKNNRLFAEKNGIDSPICQDVIEFML